MTTNYEVLLETHAITGNAVTLADAIRSRVLIEDHHQTIDRGLELLTTIGEQNDIELGIDRHLSHTDAFNQAWNDLEVQNDFSVSQEGQTPSAISTWSRLVDETRIPYRSIVSGYISEATSGSYLIPKDRVDRITELLKNIGNSYDITSAIRDDLATKLEIAPITYMDSGADLATYYRRKLLVKDKKKTLSSYPDGILAARHFDSLAYDQATNISVEMGTGVTPDELIQLIKAGLFISLQQAIRNEKTAFRELRIKYFESVLLGDVDSAQRDLMAMVEDQPEALPAATYALLGLNPGDREDLIHYARRERRTNVLEAVQKAIDDKKRKRELEKQELQDAESWFERNQEALKGQVGEILDEEGESTGRLFMLHNFMERRSGTKGLSKFHCDVYQKTDGTMIFVRHVASYLPVLTIKKLKDSERVVFYDSAQDFMTSKYPGAKNIGFLKSRTAQTKSSEYSRYSHLTGWCIEGYESPTKGFDWDALID